MQLACSRFAASFVSGLKLTYSHLPLFRGVTATPQKLYVVHAIRVFKTHSRSLVEESRMVTLVESPYQVLQSTLRGKLVTPDDAGYDEARKVYNAMIDRRPAAIAFCVDAGDVIQCVNFARDNHVTLAIRGGGHNGPGL